MSRPSRLVSETLTGVSFSVDSEGTVVNVRDENLLLIEVRVLETEPLSTYLKRQMQMAISKLAVVPRSLSWIMSMAFGLMCECLSSQSSSRTRRKGRR